MPGFDPVGTALAVIDANLTAFPGAQFPHDTTAGDCYPLRDFPGYAPGANVGWTTSFWTGMLWLAFEATGEERYRMAAERHVVDFQRRVQAVTDLDHHDLGFLYTLACVAPTRLLAGTPISNRAKDAALAASDLLMRRFNEPAGIIQAWGSLDDPAQQGRVIIDSLMNLPLLWWASGTPGREHYAVAAHRHAVALRDHILRPNNTTFHTFYFDPATGAPLRGATAQGASDASCWARGQAWGIYGFALAYRHTGDATLLAASRRCADRFIANLPADKVAYWDLDFGDGSGQPRDTSASAIATCGLRLLSDACGDPVYREAADAMLASLASGYTVTEPAPGRPLLRHAVYSLPDGLGVDEGCLWGDYYYLEALLTDTTWPSYWLARDLEENR